VLETAATADPKMRARWLNPTGGWMAGDLYSLPFLLPATPTLDHRRDRFSWQGTLNKGRSAIVMRNASPLMADPLNSQ